MKRNGSFRKIARIALCVMLVTLLAATLFACNKGGTPTLTMTANLEDGAQLKLGGSVNFTVTVSDGSGYTLSVDRTDIAKIDGDTLIITKEVEEETVVTVTAKLDKNASVTASKKYTVMPKEVLPTVTLVANKASNAKIAKGDEVKFTAYVSDDSDVLFKSDKPELVEFDGNTMTVTGDVTKVTIITVTAYISGRPECNAMRSFRIMPPATTGRVVGQAFELNSEMMNVIGNDSITAQGVVTDVFENIKNGVVTKTTKTPYDFLVKMQDGAWYGSWNKQAEDEDEIVNVISNGYRIGADYFWKDANEGGHQILEQFVNKNNVADAKIVKDYKSVPAMWENQHLWNHIPQLDVNKFETVEFNEADAYEVFRYNCKYQDAAGNDTMSEADAYLMTYLSWCFTPMMTETIDFLDFVVKVDADGKYYVSEVRMQSITEYSYESENSTTTPKVSAKAYTTAQFTLTGSGTTVVPDVEPYENDNPEMNKFLEDALNGIKGQNNYIFEAVDSGTSSYNPGDYGDASADGEVTQIKNYPSATGTVGVKGYVTADAILFEDTFKYSIYQDGDDPYRITYYGYKKVNDTTYDEFEYDATLGKMAGKSRNEGTIVDDIIPKWDFSPYVFEYAYTTAEPKKGLTYHTYALRNVALTRAVAMETTMLSEAKSVTENSRDYMSITVVYNRNTKKTSLYSVDFPYDVTMASGSMKIFFKSVGKTAEEILPAGTFKNGYQQKEAITSWSQFTMTDFYYAHVPCGGITEAKHGASHPYGCDFVYDTDGSIKKDEKGNTMYVHKGHIVTADVAISQIFGDKKVISPDLLYSLFNDNVHGPWYHDKVVGKGADNKDVYRESITLTAKWKNIDENGQLPDEEYEKVITTITTKLATGGFTVSDSNSNWEGPNSVKGSFEKTRYMTYTNGETMIVFENIHTAFFYISIYKAGEWTLANK